MHCSCRQLLVKSHVWITAGNAMVCQNHVRSRLANYSITRKRITRNGRQATGPTHFTRPGPGVATGVKPGAGIQTRESQFDDTPARESMVELDSELAARIEAAWRARSSQPNGAECPHTDEGWDRNFRGRDGDVLATRGYYPRVSGETAATLASAGIQLEAGVLGYGKRCTTKPARILRDGSSVAVKIYHDVHRPVADHPHEEGAPSREIEARHEEIAEYAREMNIQAGRDMHHPNLLRILAWSARPRDWLCCERFDCTLWHPRSVDAAVEDPGVAVLQDPRAHHVRGEVFALQRKRPQGHQLAPRAHTPRRRRRLRRGCALRAQDVQGGVERASGSERGGRKHDPQLDAVVE